MSAELSRTDDAERFDRFVTLSPIRKGGMALLVQAFDTVAGVPVVLKRLPPNSEALRDRFLDEIKLSRSMAPHPNLVRTLDAGDSPGREFLAIEWIDGPDLEGLTERAIAGKLDMPVPVPVAASIMWQALRGLAHLHASGVIHRDVSAANVMVGYDGVAKLIDYGIAKYDGRRHKTQLGDGVVGTQGFAAPEQADKKEATERSDLYSVGATLWFLLTGLRFYERGVDNNGRDVLKHQLEQRGRSDVPPALLTFLWRSLHRSPSVRYDSADEAARALEQTCELATPAAVAEFVGFLFAGDKKFAAERLAEWKREYAAPAPPPAPPAAQTTAVIRAVKEPTPKLEPEGSRSTMVIDWNEPPRSRTTVLVWCLGAAFVAASSLIVAINLIARRHRHEPAPPIAVTTQTPPEPAPPIVPVPMPPAPRVEPAPVAPPPSPVEPAPSPVAPSDQAIRKRLAQARDFAAVGRINVAREVFAELEHDPRARPQALLGLARLAQTDGDFTAAIRLSTEAAKAGAGVDALIVRGGAYLAKHDADRARADFDRVLKMQPKNADAAEGLKMAAQLKGQTP